MTHIVVLGGGVMGEALIAGLLLLDPKPNIVVVEQREDRGQELVERYGVSCADSRAAVAGAQVIIAVVKPQDMRAALDEISDVVPTGALIISIAAGVTTETIESLVPQAAVVRAMPNTPARIQRGVIGMSAGLTCQPEQFAQAVEYLDRQNSLRHLRNLLLSYERM